jgi:hypothetical protein
MSAVTADSPLLAGCGALEVGSSHAESRCDWARTADHHAPCGIRLLRLASRPYFRRRDDPPIRAAKREVQRSPLDPAAAPVCRVCARAAAAPQVRATLEQSTAIALIPGRSCLK